MELVVFMACPIAGLMSYALGTRLSPLQATLCWGNRKVPANLYLTLVFHSDHSLLYLSFVNAVKIVPLSEHDEKEKSCFPNWIN